MTKEKIDPYELEKTRIAVWAFLIGAIMFVAIIGMNLAADTITHKFKNPSFSGIATSSHYLRFWALGRNRRQNLNPGTRQSAKIWDVAPLRVACSQPPRTRVTPDA